MRTKAKIACSHSCKLDVTPYTYCCHTNIGQLFYLIEGVFFLLQLMHWLFICTCWSIRAFKGLMTTPIAEFPIARGARNRQRDFPAPVAILTNTSLPWTRGKRASNCPGRKLLNLKYFWRAASNLFLQTHSTLGALHSPLAKGQLLQHTVLHMCLHKH